MLPACVLLALVSGAEAHVRLVTSNGYELRWGQPANVSIVINDRGSDDIPERSGTIAIRNAIRAWNQVAGSAARLVENQSPASRARTDWQSDGIHLVLFDEDGSSGYFLEGSGIVAITPVWFTASGVVSDADVLFNGRDFAFTTRGEPGAFDVQDVAAHELGHFLGLDHSGWAGATMYPYVDTTVILHRSLSQDEVCGLRAAYPQGAFGALSGTVRNANDDYVAGAHVVARDVQGRPCASVLSSNLGFFTLRGLPAGAYALYATPFEGPVGVHNLSGSHPASTGFRTTPLGSFQVGPTGTVSAGELTVLGDAAVSLGRASDDLPLRCVVGRTRAATLRGTGLVAGSTLECSDQSVAVAPLSWGTTQVSFQVSVPDDEPTGLVDLTVVSPSGQRSTLVAALDVTPPDPLVTAVYPARGSIHGGDVLTITGSGFRPGASVVLGSRSYVTTPGGGASVVDEHTIRLTSAAEEFGLVDVVVIDSSGVEGRLGEGYAFEALPGITSVFPPSGSAAGGTALTVSGSDFVEGCSVWIDGVLQTSVERVSSSKLVVTTSPGVPGGPYQLDVRTPLGETASASFAYAVEPDPLVGAIDPASGPDEGGSVVTIHGANFTPSCAVWFGADADTGAGGTVAAHCEIVDANTLRVVAPACASGARSVIVRDTRSHQAAVAPVPFVYRSSGGGGGGACALVRPASGAGPLRGASNLAAPALALVWLALRARRARVQPA